MADSNPFSHVGLGMMGADASIARSAAIPQPLFQKSPMPALLAMGISNLGLKDFLNSIGGNSDDKETVGGIAPPPVAGTGINPMGVGVVPPGGVGMQNKSFAEGMQPRPYTMQGFGGSGGYSLPQSPYQFNQPNQADDTRKQILSSWGS